MKGLKCTEQTRLVSFVLFTVYFLYGMFKIPFLEYITCLAVGGVIYGVTHSIEFGLLGLLIANLILPMFRSVQKEGFEDKEAASAASASSAPAPEDATASAKEAVTGAVSTKLDSANVDLKTPSAEFTGTSTPASVSASLNEKKKVEKISEKNTPPAVQPADLIPESKEEFEDSKSAGLFKLGKIPTDEKGGFHIDAGTSVLNALKSLKPDQISAMTQDTKQLIETQKTLMGMVQSFKPMMSEGKEMMDTFQSMFSPTGGSAMGALQAAQDTLKR